MTILYEQRSSDSLYVETVTKGRTARDGGSIRPAECQCHMVFVREHGNFHPFVFGPLTRSDMVAWQEGAEILWIKFKPGGFMLHMHFQHLLDREITLPDATGQSFWLKNSTWQSPNYENTETFIDRLAREEVLVRDSVVTAVLQDEPHEMAPRTVRHHFRRNTFIKPSMRHRPQHYCDSVFPSSTRSTTLAIPITLISPAHSSNLSVTHLGNWLAGTIQHNRSSDEVCKRNLPFYTRHAPHRLV